MLTLRHLAVLGGLLLPHAAGAQSPADVRARLLARIGAVPGAQVAIAVQDLASGRRLSVDGDSVFHAASTMKVPVLFALYQEFEAGRLRAAETMRLENRFRSIVDQSEYTLNPADDSDSSVYALVGTDVPLRDLASRMITHSSNLATNALISRLDPVRITALTRELGATTMIVRRGVEDNVAFRAGLNNTATANDLVALFVALQQGRVSRPEGTREMLAVLEAQAFNDEIPAGLAAEDARGAQDRVDHGHAARRGPRVSGRPGTVRHCRTHAQHSRSEDCRRPDRRLLAYHLGVAGRARAAVTRAADVRYVAFLRGINVGGHRVSMADLRALFTELKLANVDTFIASGNVIFDAPAATDAAALEQRIAAHLERALGYAVPTFLRTPDDVAAVGRQRPFPDGDMAQPGHTVHVGFLRRVPDANVTAYLAGSATAMDAFAIHGRELYWLVRGKTMESLVKWPAVERAVQLEMTMRNLTSVRKLAAKLVGP